MSYIELGKVYIGKDTTKREAVEYVCEKCNSKVIVRKDIYLKKKNKNICVKCVNKTHGFSNTRLYSIYTKILDRCNNPKCRSFNNYGGRGITVYEEWLGKYGLENFIKWAKSNGYSDELTIDRINNDKGYSPSNCRWVNRVTQARNTRLLQKSNSSGYRGVIQRKDSKSFLARITIDGVRINLGEYKKAEEAGFMYDKYIIDNHLTDFPLNGVNLDYTPKRLLPGKPVDMLDKETGEYIRTFDSAVSAAKYLGFKSSHSINNMLAGRTKTAYGYKWRFSNEK